MTGDNFLLSVEKGVLSRNSDDVSRAVQSVIKERMPLNEISSSLARGIERARENFRNGIFSIPDFLLAIDAYRQGLKILKENSAHKKKGEAEYSPRIVIGVVEGDVHDMGKNIVAAVLEACGFIVHDVGRNASNEAFIDAIKQTGAAVLALSTMMSTTLDTMRELIYMVRNLFPDIVIIVGGAPFDADLARRIGADGYAENAISAPDVTKRLLMNMSAQTGSIK